MKSKLRCLMTLQTVLFALLFALFISPVSLAAELDQDVSDKTDAAMTGPEQEILLVKRVRLIDPADQSKDQIVNILIVDRLLDVVTKDEISEEGVTTILDAHNGFLLGKLEIGKIAGFMILDQDPRVDVNVLLDTKKYAYLAIVKGQVVLNRYVEVSSPEPALPAEKEPKKGGWIAYTPPPTSLPVAYQSGKRPWNTWDNDYFSGIFIAAVVLDRQDWLSQDSASKTQLGEDLNDYDGGEIRGLRFGAAGLLKFDNPWVYTFAGATNAFDKGYETKDIDNVTLFDWRLDIPLSQKNTLSVGKQKEPISMERIIGMVELPMTERSAVSDALFPSRNVGIVFNGNGFDQRATWAGGFFNDWFDSNANFGDSSNQFVGRFTCLPLLDQSENSLLHLGFGFRYSDAKEDVRYLTEPEFNKAPLFVDTGLIAANSTTTYNLEATVRTGPFWLAGEYTKTDVNATALDNPTLDGYHVTLSWIMTGEIRPYRKTTGIMGNVPVARDVNQGGWGAWESAVRWSTLDANDGLLTGGEMDILSLGLNWYLTEKFRFQVNYRHISLDRFGVTGKSDGVTTRIVLFL